MSFEDVVQHHFPGSLPEKHFVRRAAVTLILATCGCTEQAPPEPVLRPVRRIAAVAMHQL